MKSISGIKMYFILIYIFFSSVSAFAQCMSGAYTIGENPGEFKTFKSAVDSLIKKGVCGPVSFTVRPGIYAENLSIPAIPGAGPENKITFTGTKAGESVAELRLGQVSASENEFILQLEGSSHMIFRNLKFTRTESAASPQVLRLKNSQDNLFENNVFSCPGYKLFSGANDALVHIAGLSNGNSFLGNNFINGASGIYIEGNTGNRTTRIQIKGNSFRDQAESGITLTEVDAPVISKNSFRHYGEAAYRSAVYISSSDGATEISSNLIDGSYYYGIRLSECFSKGEQLTRVFNNLIRTNLNSWNFNLRTSLYIENSSGIHFYYNTLVSTAGAIKASNSTDLIFKNNLVTSYSTALELANGSTIMESDFNNWYNGNSINFFRIGDTYYNTLEDFRNITQTDKRSVNVNPVFSNSNMLHLEQDVDLNGKASPVAGITTDYDGDIRSADKPDIGADEFALFERNIGVTGLVNPEPIICPGMQSVRIAIRNAGSADLSTFTIYTEINGNLLPGKIWKGLLPSAAADTVTATEYNFIKDSIYSVKIWISNLNNSTDEFPSNDAIIRENILTRMGGTYTIGGLNPDFKGFSEAAYALNKRGVCEPVLFSVRKGTYREKIALAMVYGTSKENTVTFRSEYDNNTQVVMLAETPLISDQNEQTSSVSADRCNFISFDKITFTVESRDNTYSNIALNLSKNIRFNNCIFKGAEISAKLTGCDSTLFNNCHFTGKKNAVMSVIGHLAITNNTFHNYSDFALHLEGARGIVSGNSIFQQQGPGILTRGSSIEISSNQIECKNGQYGIYSYYDNGSKLVNNTIDVTNLSLNSQYAYGIYLEQSTDFLVAHNTVKLETIDSTASAPLYFNTAQRKLKIRNNIFCNNGKGRAVNYITSPYDYTSDFNNYYTKGTYLISGSRTLEEWVSSVMQMHDTRSVSVNPELKSPGLHTSSVQLADKGENLNITRDIDGDLRDTIPDLGADEFSSHKFYDIGISYVNKGKNTCHGTPSVYFRVKNYGKDTVYNVTVNYVINQEQPVSAHFRLKLAPGQESDSLAAGNYNFRHNSMYRLSIWTSSAADKNNANDTVKTSLFSASMGGIYTIGGNNPDFNTLSEAASALQSLGLCAPATLRLRKGNYEEEIILNKIPGISASNSLIIESETNTAQDVILHHTRIRTPVLSLYNGSYITIRNLTIKQESYQSFHAQTAVLMDSSNNNILFENNIIRGGITSKQFSNKIKIRNNIFDPGFIDLKGYSTGQEDSLNIISGNRFLQDFTNNIEFTPHIQADYQKNLTIENNQFEKTFGSVIGVSNSASPLTINGNRINALPVIFNDEGLIDLDNCRGTETQPVQVSNNFVFISEEPGTQGKSTGIQSSGSQYVNIYHNTIYLNNGSSGYGIQGLHNAGLDIKNNIIVNITSGFAICVYPLESLKSDYNILHSASGNFGCLPDINPNLEMSPFDKWQAAGFDLHSKVLKPIFVKDLVTATDKSDLHLDRNSLHPPTVANPILKISTDIDGESRDNSNPVAGADEFIPVQYNISIAGLTEESTLPCEGLNDVKVLIINSGKRKLTKATIGWAVNNVKQQEYNWNGVLDSEDTTIVAIGQWEYFKNGEVKIKAWTQNPEDVIDEYTIGDTTIEYFIRTSLHGSYTIGGTNPDYGNFTEAVNALKKQGICGPVVFNIRAGVYQEQIRIPQIRGASSINTITFRSESGDSTSVVLSHNHTNWSTAANYTLYVDGCDYLNFSRISFKAEAEGNNHCRVIFITNNSDHVTISNCIIENENNGFGEYFEYNNTVHIGDDYLEGTDNDFISVKNNIIRNGSTGLSFHGSNSAGEIYTEGLLIEGNIFEGDMSKSIDIWLTSAPSVRNNKFNASVIFNQCSDSTRIISNIFNLSGEEYVDLDFLWGKQNAPAIIANNSILNLSFTNPYGFFRVKRSDYAGIIHNTVGISGPVQDQNNYAFYTEKCNNCSVLNNIFYNRMKGPVAVVSAGDNFYSDYNDYFSSVGILIRAGLTEYSSLKNYSDITQLEIHSLAVNPVFVSETDYHLTPTSPLTTRGKYLPAVLTDIDGEIRNIIPDLGADEVVEKMPDQSAFIEIAPLKNNCPGNKNISVKIINSGKAILTNLGLELWFNGSPVQPSEWNGSLKSGHDTTLLISGLSMQTGQNNFKILIKSINGQVLSSSDTISALYQIQTLVRADFSHSIKNDTLYLRNLTQNATNYKWQIGNYSTTSKDVNYYLTYSRTIPVKLTAENSCFSDSVTVPVYVKLPSDLNITGISQSISCNSADNPVLSLIYNGKDTLRNLMMQWELQGITQKPVKISDVILPFNVLYTELPVNVTDSSRKVLIKVWIDIEGDTNSSNNSFSTLLINNLKPEADFSYKFENGYCYFTNKSKDAQTYTWMRDGHFYSSDTDISFPIADGLKTEIILSANNGCGNSLKYATIVYLVSGTDNQDGISVNTAYPNPFTDYLTIDGGAIEKVTITNVTGHKVFESRHPGSAPLTINTEKLVSGVYIVELRYADSVRFITLTKD